MEKIPELPVALDPYDSPRLPEVAKQYYVSPNTFLQSAMFGMVQRGRRKYIEKKKIVSFQNIVVFFTGGELDQAGWESDLPNSAVRIGDGAIGEASGHNLAQKGSKGDVGSG